MVTDALLYAKGTPGVDLSRISCPVVFLHGGQDHAVPQAVAQLASRQVPDSAVKLLAGKGHLFFAKDPGYMLDEMRETAH
jgi:pimeloyl-ACP methyl ester carboxylesterase